MKSKHPYIIAEIAQAHDGSLGLLHSMIDAAADAGAHAVKFQMHIAEAESSSEEPFRIPFSYVDKTRYDYWKRMEFTLEHWVGIRDHCYKRNCDFLCSPFSIAAIENLERLEAKSYKIASGETENFLLLEKICRTGKPLIISTGLSDLVSVDKTLKFIDNRCEVTGLLQCTTMYPTPAKQVGLNVLKLLRDRYQLPVGLSDHSGSIYAGLAAVSLGAELLEVHVAFDKKMFGPDASSSLTFAEFKQLVDGVHFIAEATSLDFDKTMSNEKQNLKKIFGKTLALNKTLAKGSVIRFDDLESKKPGGLGIPASEFSEIIGRKLKSDKEKYSFLTYEDLA